MFDVGFSELLLLAIVALVVLGPEKLPHAARIAGAWVGRIRRTVSHMQAEIEREVSAQEFKARMDKEFNDIGGSNLIQELQAETRTIEAGFHDVESRANDSLAAVSLYQTESTSISSTTSTSSLADAAIPLDHVEMDGEKAYREWLDAQKGNRILPPEKPANDSPADPASP